MGSDADSSEVRVELSSLLRMKDRAKRVAAPVLVSTSARTYASESLSDQIDAPSNTISFNKNCPETTAKAGNPPKLGSQPGDENKKLRVVKTSVSPAIGRVN